MGNDLGTLEVGFAVNLGGLDSGFNAVEERITSFGPIATEAADQIGAALNVAGDSANALAEMFQMSSENMAAALDLPIEQVTAMQAAAEEAAAGTSASLEEITAPVDSLGAAFDEMTVNVTQNITNINTQIGEMGARAEEAGSQVSSAAEEASGSSGGGGLMSLVSSAGMAVFGMQAIVQVGGQLASSLLGPAVSAETVTSALTTLDGSAQKAQQEMQALNQFASKTPFKTLDIDQAAEQLQGFGTKAGDVVPELTAIGDALGSVGKDTPAELDSVVQIFGKMRTEGKVTAATMNELAVHGINGWQALSDATGKSIPQLKEMVAKGLLPANAAIDDLTKGIEMNPLYKGGMARAAGTFSGLLSTLQSNWDQVLAAFGSPIISALEGSLTGLGNELASPAFQQFAGAIGQGIVGVFQSIGNAGTYVFNVLKSLNLSGLNQAWHDLTSAVQPLISDFQNLGNVLHPVQGDFDPLAEAIANIGKSGIGALTGFIEGLAQALQGLGKGGAGAGFLGSMATGFKEVQKVVGGTLTDDFQFFQNTVADLGKWWQSDMMPAIKAAEPGFEHLGSVLATTVAPAIAKVWSVGQQLLRDIVGPAIKGFEAIEPVLVRVGGFLADKLGNALQVVTPDIVSAAQAVGQFANDIESRAEPILKQLGADLKIFLDWIGPYWPSIWNGISSTFTLTWAAIKGTFQIAWSLFSGSWKVMLDIFSGNWKQAWEDIKGTFKGIWDGIVTIAQGAFGPIWGPIRSGINGVIDIIDGFISRVDSIHVNVPGVGNVGVSIPLIPHLAAGGIVPPGGMAIAGDPGPNEEVVLGGTSGATVLSNAQSSRLLAQSIGAAGGKTVQEIHVHVYIDGMEMTDSIGNRLVNTWLTHGPVKTLRST